MHESSSTTISYSAKKLSITIPGTATVIFGHSTFSTCDYRIRTAIQNANLRNLTFINLNLRQEMLNELRLKMSGILNSQNSFGDDDLPLACDYFFYVDTTAQDEVTLINIQFVNAKSGAIEWSVHLEHEECEGVALQLAKLLN